MRPPRSTYRTSSPSASTTRAPAFRPGRCPPGVSSGRTGHGSDAPYALAGSAAASTITWARRPAPSRPFPPAPLPPFPPIPFAPAPFPPIPFVPVPFASVP